MKNRILGYRTRIDEIIEKNAPDTDWQELLNEHMVQIGFFQHERLVHLLVTLAFALFAIMTIFVTIFSPNPGLFALIILFLVLLIPYIQHYYLLENETQKMYVQYDKILAHIREEKGGKK